MENQNCNPSLKRGRNEELGFFKIIHTDTDPDDHTINANKKRITSEYKIVYNETRQSNRHKNPSGVWKYFALATKQKSTSDICKDEPDDRVLCMLCYSKGRVHVYKSKTSSSNLWKHLNRKHDIEIPTERMFAVSTSSLDRFEFGSEEIGDGTTSSNDYPLPALDEDTNDVLIKSNDFEDVEEYTEDEVQNMQSDLSIEEEEQNVHTLFKYDVCPTTISAPKDIGLAILEEVAKRPILYDAQSNKIASLRATKELMWVEVYEALGQIIPIERIQKIWKNIRDRYKKIRNIERDGMKCLAKYKYYDHLSFLDDDEQLGCQLSDEEFEELPDKKPHTEDFSFLIEQTDGILTSVDDLVQSDQQNYTTEDVVSDTSSNCIVSSSNPPSLTTTIYPLEMNPNNSDIILPKRTPSPTLVAAAATPQPPQTPLPAAQHIQTSSPSMNNTEQMDEFDLFGKLIANKLRSAPRDRVNLIEVKIMQAILENT